MSPSPSRRRVVALAGAAAAVVVALVSVVAVNLSNGGATKVHVAAKPTAPSSLLPIPTFAAPPSTFPSLPSSSVPTTPAPTTTAPAPTSSSTSTTVPNPCPTPHIAEYTASAANAKPGAVTVGGDGNVWFADWSVGAIERIKPSNPVAYAFGLPAGDHALQLTSGPDANLWFTDPNAGAVGRMTLTGTVTEFPTPTRESNPMGVAGQTSNPLSIVAGPDGALWFTESMADQIGRVTLDGAITEYPLPSRDRVHANPEGITVGPDGAVWFTEPLVGKLGRIDPTSHVITEFVVGGGGGAIGGATLVSGPDGRLWTDAVSQVEAITTKGVVTSYPVPDANAWVDAVRPDGPGGLVWVLDGRGGSLDSINAQGNVTRVMLTGPAGQGFSGDSLGMIVGPDHALWFAEGSVRRIAKLTC